MLWQPQFEENGDALEPKYGWPLRAAYIEIEPDKDEQTVVQAATNSTVAISVPLENQAAVLPDSYVTRSGKISKPPERLDM